MKIYFASFGCKVNRYETDVMAQEFEKIGGEKISSPEGCDVCVINSCTVTANADADLQKFIRSVKRRTPECVIALTGCFAQAFPEKAAELGADIITGSGKKTSLPQLVQDFFLTKNKVCEVGIVPREFEPMSLSHGSGTRAFIKIQDGCDMFCTYCIIPFARGHIRSKPLDDLRREAENLVRAGHRELVLTGINICCYGRENRLRLVDAIETVCAVKGDFRVRLGSIEPEMISDEDIARLKALDKLCPQFHLSLQSGCDRVLSAMNRHYDTALFTELVRKLRTAFPDCAITTDIMAGFPTETEQEHIISMDYIGKIGFAKAHVFPYSERSGTKAAEMNGRLDSTVKNRRARELISAARQSALEYNRKFVGRTVEVLFERETEGKPHAGHSREYHLVKVPNNGEASWHKIMKRVRITEAYAEYLVGVDADGRR